MSIQWNARMRPSNIGGCQPNQATYTGAFCFDLASASAIAFCRLLATIDQISMGFFAGNALAYESTTASVLSPNRSFSLAFTPSRSICSSFASVRLGDCSLNVEQMISGIFSLNGVAIGE